MDFSDDAEAALFRTQLREWLGTNQPREPEPINGLRRARFWADWHAALHAGGWMGLSWPEEFGGRNLPATFEALLNDEVGRAGAPPVPHVGFLGRAILHYGTEVQKQRYLPGLLSGAEVWCQGFSEPNAGSDLANLSTSAVRSGDNYIVTGQKIWTSDAAWADWCLLLVRTDTEAPKHSGMSMLIVDMRSSGIDVRPITQSNGDSEFNEVFFTEVQVPCDAVVGALGDGWRIAMTTVGYERGPADVGFSSRYARLMGKLVDDFRGTDPSPADRVLLARSHVAVEVLRSHVLRSLTARNDAEGPGPEGSIDKLLSTLVEQRLHHAAMDLHGAAAMTGASPKIQADYFYSRAASIAGGTAQIQRTIVAEQLLDLPRWR